MRGRLWRGEVERGETERHAGRHGTSGPDGLDCPLLDALHDAIYSLSPDRRILTWNAAAQRIYGFRPEEVIGRTVDEALRTRFSTGESHAQVYAELDRAAALELVEGGPFDAILCDLMMPERPTWSCTHGSRRRTRRSRSG